tara:strand:- start:1772 stop:2068 length:297 start_codon:yes stop_codon:yes gene_type:complete
MSKITDPRMKPYYIGKDSHCYTVYEVVTPQEKYLEKGSEGKDYEKPVAHYSSFGNALRKVMKEKLHNETEEYTSIKDYIERWEQLQNEITEILTLKQL